MIQWTFPGSWQWCTHVNPHTSKTYQDILRRVVSLSLMEGGGEGEGEGGRGRVEDEEREKGGRL